MSAARARRIGTRADQAASVEADARSGKKRLKVVEVSSRRSSRLLGVIGSLALLTLFVSLFGMAAFHAVIVQGQNRIDELDKQVTTSRSQSQRLRLELAELTAPDRIVEEAKTRLGMVEPPSVVYLTPSTASATNSAPITESPIGE
jgi:cell division protein FtsL